MLAAVYLAVAVIKNTSGAYAFAGAASALMLFRALLPWMRSKGLPEWAADEAYITRLRRWRHSQRTQD